MKSIMKYAFTCVALLIISISYANAQETAVEKNNPGLSIYLHPATLAFSGFTSMNFIYMTFEMPFNSYMGLIVKPSLWTNEYCSSCKYQTTAEWDDLAETNFVRFGSDLGLRFYPNGNNAGLYLQGQAGAFYIWKEGMANIKWLDVMGYAGWAVKSVPSTYLDLGAGCACIDKHCGFMFDINMGVGLMF